MQELFNLEGEVVADSRGQWITIGETKVFHWYCESKKHLHVDPQIANNCCRGKSVQEVKAKQPSERKETRRLDENWFEVALFCEGDLE